MAVKFDFLSPGVQLREFDVSQVPAAATADGICIIGTAPQGPGNIPVKVRDFETFQALYGTPSAGRGMSGDSGYRSSSFTDVSYGMYAAQAWLNTTDAPVTFVRLIGEKHPDQTTAGLLPGWKTDSTSPQTSESNLNINGGAYGLFVFPSGSDANATDVTGTLGAIFYVNQGGLRLSGSSHIGGTGRAACGVAIRSATGGNASAFTIEHVHQNGADAEKYSFDFSGGGNGSDIRSIFNTDPQKTNSSVHNGANTDKNDQYFWLGESYAEAVESAIGASGSAGEQVGVLLYMGGGSGLRYGHKNREASYAKTGWFFSNDPADKGNGSGYDPITSTEKLFRICSIYKGSQCQKTYKVKIGVDQLEDGNGTDVYSKFSLYLVDRRDESVVIEQWRGLDFNPASSDFIGSRIGNQYFTWSNSEKKYKVNGQYPNQSSHIRVEMSDAVKNGTLTNKGAAPWGVHGPIKIADAYYGGSSANLKLSSSAALNADHALTGMFLGDDSQIVFGTADPVAAKATLDITATTSAFDHDHSFSIAVPVSMNGEAGNAVKIMFGNGAGSGGADQIRIRRDANNETATDVDLAQLLVFAINGTTPSGPQAGGSGNYDSADVGFANGGTNGTAGVAGITASRVGAVVTITADLVGADGNTITLTDVSNNPIASSNLGSSPQTLANGVTAGSDAILIDELVSSSGKVKIEFPSLKLTTTGSNDAGANYPDADIQAYGLGTKQTLAGDSRVSRHGSFIDLVRSGPAVANGSSLEVYSSGEADPGSASGLAYQYSFSLDDVRVDSDDNYFYEAGSRNAESGSNLSHISGCAEMVEVLDIAHFSSPFFGGFDGVDITEPNPFSNRYLDGNSLGHKSVKNNYALYSYNKALDSIRDSEVVGMDLVSFPGLTTKNLTTQILTLAATRGDCLAIIDPEGGLSPAGEDAVEASAGSIKTTVTNLRGRRINNSYGCMYYPWVRVSTPQSNAEINMPPSVAAIGAMAGSDLASFPWFAPAGFRRGGLSPLGSSATGLSVVGTEEHLTKKNRDSLYSNNINPIARFPASNDIVVFGQKTLQRTRSALDRINVRRMMIYLKKQIGAIADEYLFEQNISSTWRSFRNRANRVLNQLRADGGITEYKLVLDSSTTTPDLVDRNILYAKVFVKPARSIEFIVVDFVVTRSGVDFNSVSY